MSYSKTVWINNASPSISASNLNNIEQGIYDTDAQATENKNDIAQNEADIEQNEADIAALVTGEVPKGAWTPEVGTEYPTSYQEGWSWYISAVSENGYTFTGGDLNGFTAKNMDKLIRVATGWSLIENNLLISLGVGTIGNINNTLCELPLLNSIAMTKGAGSTSYTLATGSTFIDRYKNSQTAEIDEPRFNENGLICEGEGTNELLYSEDFSNAIWVATAAATKTSTTELAPDGNNTAGLITDANLYANRFSNTIAGLGGTGTINTASIWLKGTADDVFQIRVVADISEIYYIDITDEWVRYDFLSGANDSATNIVLQIFGNGGAESPFYVWGGQLEEKPFATSYIPTTTTSVTRDGSVQSFPAKGNISGNQEHAFGFDYVLKSNGNTGGNTYMLVISDRGSNFLYLYTDTNNARRIRMDSTSEDGDITQRPIDFGFDIGVKYRMRIVFEANRFVMYMDGEQVFEYAGTWKMANLASATINFGTASGNTINGEYSNFMSWNKAPTLTELLLEGKA